MLFYRCAKVAQILSHYWAKKAASCAIWCAIGPYQKHCVTSLTESPDSLLSKHTDTIQHETLANATFHNYCNKLCRVSFMLHY